MQIAVRIAVNINRTTGADFNATEVKAFLSSLDIPDHDVLVIWIAFRVGISMSFHDFVQYYDDLWFPSSDDIWMSDRSCSWLLELHHEEYVTFVKVHA